MDADGVKRGTIVALAGAIAFAFGVINSDTTPLRIFGGFGLIGLIIGVAVIFDRI